MDTQYNLNNGKLKIKCDALDISFTDIDVSSVTPIIQSNMQELVNQTTTIVLDSVDDILLNNMQNLLKRYLNYIEDNLQQKFLPAIISCEIIEKNHHIDLDECVLLSVNYLDDASKIELVVRPLDITVKNI